MQLLAKQPSPSGLRGFESHSLRQMMKVFISELPNVPDITHPFVIGLRADLDFLLANPGNLWHDLVEKINQKGLKAPAPYGDIKCRMNPDTFEMEGFIDGKWQSLDPVIDHILARFASSIKVK